MNEFKELIERFDALATWSRNNTSEKVDRKTRDEVRRLERELEKAIEPAYSDYDLDFADCRDIGHSWSMYHSAWEGNIAYRYLSCKRCGTERHDNLSRFGGLVARRYVYPEGYLLDGSAVLASDRRLWRAANVERIRNA